jgi:hypothetical protein
MQVKVAFAFPKYKVYQNLFLPTDRGIERVRKLITLVGTIPTLNKQKEICLFTYEFDFEKNEKLFIELGNSDQKMLFTRKLIRCLSNECVPYAILDNSSLFVIPSDNIVVSIKRIAQMNVKNLSLRSNTLKRIIEEVLDECGVSVKSKTNSVTVHERELLLLQVYKKLGVEFLLQVEKLNTSQRRDIIKILDSITYLEIRVSGTHQEYGSNEVRRIEI